MKTRLNFFHNGNDREETLGTWGPSFIFIPINLTTTSHPHHIGPQNTFLVTLWKDPILTGSNRRWPGRASLRSWHSRWCGSLKMWPLNSLILFTSRDEVYVPLPCPLNLSSLTAWQEDVWQQSKAEVMPYQFPALSLNKLAASTSCVWGDACSWTWSPCFEKAQAGHCKHSTIERLAPHWGFLPMSLTKGDL